MFCREKKKSIGNHKDVERWQKSTEKEKQQRKATRSSKPLTGMGEGSQRCDHKVSWMALATDWQF
jgi:hypothetical protein